MVNLLNYILNDDLLNRDEIDVVWGAFQSSENSLWFVSPLTTQNANLTVRRYYADEHSAYSDASYLNDLMVKGVRPSEILGEPGWIYKML